MLLRPWGVCHKLSLVRKRAEFLTGGPAQHVNEGRGISSVCCPEEENEPDVILRRKGPLLVNRRSISP